MSVNKFKVGDKVRVRDDIAKTKDHGRDGVCIADEMKELAGNVFTIDKVRSDCYDVKGSEWVWNDEMLELAEKSLYNLCVGDFVKSGGGIRKVLAAVDGCYLLSNIADYTTAGYPIGDIFGVAETALDALLELTIEMAERTEI